MDVQAKAFILINTNIKLYLGANFLYEHFLEQHSWMLRVCPHAYTNKQRKAQYYKQSRRYPVYILELFI